MDILKMLSELRAERERLSEAILVMERLAVGQPRGRGRPRKDAIAEATPTPVPAKKKRGRTSMSEEQRAAQAARMKEYWSKRRKAEAK